MKANFVDPVDFLERLHQAAVRYVLVGRQAVAQYGAPVQTMDYDFYLHPSADDLERLRGVAEALDLEGMPDPGAASPMFSLQADGFKADFFRARAYALPDGDTLTFDEIYGRHVALSDDELTVHVPAIGDLIRTKRLRNNSRDREDIAYLELIREMTGER